MEGTGGAYRALAEGSEGKKLCIWKNLRRRNGIINMDLTTFGRAWTRLMWFRTVTGSELFCKRYGNLEFREMRGFD
jgi:hypothetical protein